MTIKTVCMETPLGDVTISGGPEIVDEVVKRCNSHKALLEMCKALHDELTSYVTPTIYDADLIVDLAGVIAHAEEAQ